MSADEDERLTIIADICETVPPGRLNNDVAYGISYTIGYLGGLDNGHAEAIRHGLNGDTK